MCTFNVLNKIKNKKLLWWKLICSTFLPKIKCMYLNVTVMRQRCVLMLQYSQISQDFSEYSYCIKTTKKKRSQDVINQIITNRSEQKLRKRHDTTAEGSFLTTQTVTRQIMSKFWERSCILNAPHKNSSLSNDSEKFSCQQWTKLLLHFYQFDVNRC